MNPQKLSRLEVYLEILKALQTVTKITDIQAKINIDQTILASAMSFLEQQNLIQKEPRTNEPMYRTTPRGNRVATFFEQSNPPSDGILCEFNEQ